jgi:site-specific recombinase XerD
MAILRSKPVVAVYVRHKSTCSKSKHGEFYHACECPKWLRYSFNGKQQRIPAGTRSWGQAEERAKEKQHQLDSGSDVAIRHDSENPTIKQAIEKFLIRKEGSGKCDVSVLAKYRRELARFETFMSERSRFYPADIRLEDVEAYRAGWKAVYGSSQTRQQVQTRLRGFLRYCHTSEWLTKLPELDAIEVDESPTLPLTRSEYTKLLAEIPTAFDTAKAQKVHALVQLMRHSGLAIRDAVTLRRDEIQYDKEKKIHRIVTNRQKTGTHVSVPIQPEVATELLTVLNGSPQYVFWNTGNGKEQSAVTNWQHDLRLLFRSTFGQDTDFTPHCLRDTFAVEMLSAGVPMEEVSKMLGHENMKTTEKSYAKWAKSRQDRTDDLVMGTWEKQ